MLCPEVWKINAPDHNITYNYGVLDEKQEVIVNKRINNHFYNKMVSILSYLLF